jgi:hypothetical protein
VADENKLVMTITVFEDSDPFEVAVAMYGAFWKSGHCLNLDEMTINGKSVSDKARRAYAQQALEARQAVVLDTERTA